MPERCSVANTPCMSGCTSVLASFPTDHQNELLKQGLWTMCTCDKHISCNEIASSLAPARTSSERFCNPNRSFCAICRYCEAPINNYAHAGKGLPTGLHGEKLSTDHTGILNKPVGPSRSTATGTGLTGSHTTGAGLTGTHTTGTGLTGTHTTGTGLTGHSPTAGTTAAAHPKKKSLLQKIEDKIMPGHSSH
jgi:hypothetical protein